MFLRYRTFHTAKYAPRRSHEPTHVALSLLLSRLKDVLPVDDVETKCLDMIPSCDEVRV